MAILGLRSFLCRPIMTIQHLSHTEVRSIDVLLPVDNTKGRAYLMGGRVCQDAQENNCAITTAVEVLDVSLGSWQSFPVPLGRGAFDNDFKFQIAILDNALGTSLQMKDSVNKRFSDQCNPLTTTTMLRTTTTMPQSTATMPQTTTSQSQMQACIAFVLDESSDIVSTAFNQVRSFVA